MKRDLFITIIMTKTLFPFSGSELYHQTPSAGEVGKDLILEVVSLSDLTVVEAKGFYRVPGSVSYQEIRLTYTGTSWRMRIDGRSLSEKGLEYCFTFNMSNGSMMAAPAFDPFEQPFFIQINPGKEKGNIIEKRTRAGKIFYACDTYPDCEHALWSKPTGDYCPECKQLLLHAAQDKIKCENCNFTK